MSALKSVMVMLLAGAICAAPVCLPAAEKKPAKTAVKPKPYLLKTCIVQDEKLGADTYVFVHQGQEIKLCCEGCKDDFLKEPAKYLKKLDAAAKKPAK